MGRRRHIETGALRPRVPEQQIPTESDVERPEGGQRRDRRRGTPVRGGTEWGAPRGKPRNERERGAGGSSAGLWGETTMPWRKATALASLTPPRGPGALGSGPLGKLGSAGLRPASLSPELACRTGKRCPPRRPEGDTCRSAPRWPLRRAAGQVPCAHLRGGSEAGARPVTSPTLALGESLPPLWPLLPPAGPLRKGASFSGNRRLPTHRSLRKLPSSLRSPTLRLLPAANATRQAAGRRTPRSFPSGHDLH